MRVKNETKMIFKNKIFVGNNLILEGKFHFK